MPVEVGTTTQSAATNRYSGRKVLRTANGTLWVIVLGDIDTKPIFRYSTDDGATWATSSTAFPENINNQEITWTICSDGAIYALYTMVPATDIYVRKGTLDGPQTNISWSSKVEVWPAGQSLLELVAHEEGGSTIVHMVFANFSTSTYYRRLVWGGSLSSAVSLTSWNGATVPRIEFNHTLSDITAVQDSAPHIFITWYEDNKVMFQKFVYSSGPTWTPNPARTITSDAVNHQSSAMAFDGSACVIVVESLGTADALLVLERDAADTTTTSLPNTPARTGTSTAHCDLTYNPSRGIVVFHSTGVVERCTYYRISSAWGSWADVGAAGTVHPNVKRGFWSGAKEPSLDAIWMNTGGGSPYKVMHERFAFGSAAAGWGRVLV